MLCLYLFPHFIQVAQFQPNKLIIFDMHNVDERCRYCFRCARARARARECPRMHFVGGMECVDLSGILLLLID